MSIPSPVALPETIGTEVGVKLCDLVGFEVGGAFVELSNNHRPVPVSVKVDGQWTTPHEECGAYACGQIWPCDTRRALDIVEQAVHLK